MRTKTNPFLGSLRQVAIAIGKRENIRIILQGTGAKTDGRTIYLPAALPADDHSLEVMLRGFLDHEVGHIKHTEFGLPDPSYPIIHTITNIVEDIRIELAMGAEYPGCAVNMREMIKMLRDTGKITGPGEEQDPLWACLWAISYGARVTHLNNDLKEEAAAYRETAEMLLGQPVANVIDQAISESGCLSSTLEARQLAEKVYDLLKKLLEPPPQPPQADDDSKEEQGDSDQQEEREEEQGDDSATEENDKEEPETGEQQDQSEESSEPSPEQQPDNQDEPENDTEESGADQPSGTNDGQSESGSPSQEQANPSGMSPEQLQNLEDLLESSQEELSEIEENLDVSQQAAKTIDAGQEDDFYENPANSGIIDSSESCDTGEVPTFATTNEDIDPTRVAQVSFQAQKAVGLRSKLTGLFQSSKLKRDNPQLTGTRIDRRTVHRLAAGTPDARIFQQRREKVSDNTALILLIDRSGSMREEQMITATSSAYSISKAVESMSDVTCSVGAFPAYEDTGVVSLKKFGEKPQIPKFSIGSDGYTPLDGALRWAGQQIWSRQETRKIVLVLTDGAPDDWEKAVAMANLLKNNGIECYGIGIGEGTGKFVRGLFGEQSSKEIESVEQLAVAMSETLVSAMTKKR